jgi:hypothetical protein
MTTIKYAAIRRVSSKTNAHFHEGHPDLDTHVTPTIATFAARA